VLIEWTPNLSVDIKSIDEQHKKLFGYMNQLYDALTEKKEKEILSIVFKELEDYTHTHFTLEEINFAKFHYEEKDAHIMQHQMFIKKLAQLEEGIQKETVDPEELLFFLVDWLKNHIKIVDHKYVDCFHKNGLV
jgi:hemerythrin-like metal-binding protein